MFVHYMCLLLSYYVALLKAEQTDRNIMLLILSLCVACIKLQAEENDNNASNCS